MNTEQKIRSFIALDPGEEVRDALARGVEHLRRSEARVTWVPTRNLHLSLHFLGNVTPGQLERLRSGLAGIAAGVCGFEAAVSGVGVFGAPGRPRVIWAGVAHAEALARLHAETSRLLRADGLEVDARPYRGHITLGRVRAARNVDALLKAVRAMRDRPFGVMIAREVGLYRSVLKPTGAEYSLEYRAVLEGN